MEIKYQGHQQRTERAKIFWNQVVKEYNDGKSASDIARSYVNPNTGRKYNRASIYLILKRMGAI